MVDPVVNKGKVTVSTGYNSTATSIVLATGQGAELPDPVVDGAYNLPWWDSTNYNDPADDPNFEIVRVTGPAGTGDTKTIVRAQEGTAATNKNNADATYKMHLGVTAKTITDLIPEHAATVIVGKSGNVDYLTTDYGSDDACIQAAIDYVNGLGGGRILVREGLYNIDSTLLIESDIILSGVGTATIFKLSNSINTSIIENSDQVSGNSHVNLCNCEIDGNGSNQSAGDDLVYFNRSEHTLVNNVYIHDAFRNGLRVGTNSHYSNVSNCRFTNATPVAQGVSCYVSGNEHTKVINCVALDSHAHSFSFANCDYGEITNCSATNAGNWGFTFEAGTCYSTMTNCISDNSNAEGINISNSSNYNILNGCISKSGQTDYGISSAQTCEHTAILNCTVHDSCKAGIQTNGDYYKVVNNTVVDCAADCAGEPDAQRCGIGLNTSGHSLVANNVIIDTRTPKLHLYGIGEFGIADNNTIINNVIEGSLTANILKAGASSIVKNNVGYNPIGPIGPPSVPASTVNYTNEYGYPCQVQVYGGTVTEIDIDDIATGLTSGIFIIPPGGTINITYSAAPSWRWWGL